MAVPAAVGVDLRSLLALLADGRLQSGEQLARTLGVSRTAIWKAVSRLRARGILVRTAARRGYALTAAVELLDPIAVRSAMAADRALCLQGLDVAFDVDSTNTRLLHAAPPPEGSATVLLTELQHGGRGRRGREWVAPFGGSLALSVAWSFAAAERISPALSLCVGVAVARALTRAGAAGVGLKWPNDIWFSDRKMGGVLIDMRAESNGPAHVVIGVGINVDLTAAERADLESSGVRVATVADACRTPPSRNWLAGAIIDELLSMLTAFERDGFAPFIDCWRTLDALRDRTAQVVIGDNVVSGVARGIDSNGALVLERDGGTQTFVSGEVSLRLVKDDN